MRLAPPVMSARCSPNNGLLQQKSHIRRYICLSVARRVPASSPPHAISVEISIKSSFCVLRTYEPGHGTPTYLTQRRRLFSIIELRIKRQRSGTKARGLAKEQQENGRPAKERVPCVRMHVNICGIRTQCGRPPRPSRRLQ